MKIAILCSVLFICSHFAGSQNASINAPLEYKEASAGNSFLFLRGHKQGRGHSLQWSMNFNAGIEKFQVEYTYEDASDPYSNWYTAGMVNNTNANIFKFTDMGCIPGCINYRVIAILNSNGGRVSSPVYTCIIN